MEEWNQLTATQNKITCMYDLQSLDNHKTSFLDCLSSMKPLLL